MKKIPIHIRSSKQQLRGTYKNQRTTQRYSIQTMTCQNCRHYEALHSCFSMKILSHTSTMPHCYHPPTEEIRTVEVTPLTHLLIDHSMRQHQDNTQVKLMIWICSLWELNKLMSYQLSTYLGAIEQISKAPEFLHSHFPLTLRAKQRKQNSALHTFSHFMCLQPSLCSIKVKQDGQALQTGTILAGFSLNSCLVPHFANNSLSYSLPEQSLFPQI